MDALIAKPWSLCRFFQCPRPIASGGMAPKKVDRFCRFHDPARLERLAAANEARRLGFLRKPAPEVRAPGVEGLFTLPELVAGDTLELSGEKIGLNRKKRMRAGILRIVADCLSLVRFDHPNLVVDVFKCEPGTRLKRIEDVPSLVLLTEKLRPVRYPDEKKVFVDRVLPVGGMWWERKWGRAWGSLMERRLDTTDDLKFVKELEGVRQVYVDLPVVLKKRDVIGERELWQRLEKYIYVDEYPLSAEELEEDEELDEDEVLASFGVYR